MKLNQNKNSVNSSITPKIQRENVSFQKNENVFQENYKLNAKKGSSIKYLKNSNYYVQNSFQDKEILMHDKENINSSLQKILYNSPRTFIQSKNSKSLNSEEYSQNLHPNNKSNYDKNNDENYQLQNNSNNTNKSNTINSKNNHIEQGEKIINNGKQSSIETRIINLNTEQCQKSKINSVQKHKSVAQITKKQQLLLQRPKSSKLDLSQKKNRQQQEVRPHSQERALQLIQQNPYQIQSTREHNSSPQRSIKVNSVENKQKQQIFEIEDIKKKGTKMEKTFLEKKKQQNPNMLNYFNSALNMNSPKINNFLKENNNIDIQIKRSCDLKKKKKSQENEPISTKKKQQQQYQSNQNTKNSQSLDNLKIINSHNKVNELKKKDNNQNNLDIQQNLDFQSQFCKFDDTNNIVDDKLKKEAYQQQREVKTNSNYNNINSDEQIDLLKSFVTQVKSCVNNKKQESGNIQYQQLSQNQTPQLLRSKQQQKQLQLQQQQQLLLLKSQQKLNNYQKQITQDNVNKDQKNQENEYFFQNQNICQQQETKGKQSFIYYVDTIIKSFENINDDSYFNLLAREHLLQTMQAISFTRMLNPVSEKMLEEKMIYLPKKNNNKKTLVLDLDETLIHCQDSNLLSDITLPIKFPSGEQIEAGINIRPFCVQFLEEMSKIYEIIVFTASHSCYANVVLDYLDPENKLIQYRLFRENCIQTEEGIYIKDLRVLMNRNLKDIIIVDNAAYSFGFQIENGLPILPYYENKDDVELKNLAAYLKEIYCVNDVRDANNKFLKITEFGDFEEPKQLLNKLFF